MRCVKLMLKVCSFISPKPKITDKFIFMMLSILNDDEWFKDWKSTLYIYIGNVFYALNILFKLSVMSITEEVFRGNINFPVYGCPV